MKDSVRAMVFVCMLAAGCQESDGIRPPLLQITGSVEFARNADRSVAALLYSDGVSHLQLQELDIYGDFPGKARLELDEPPPDRALLDVGHLGEPKIAIGFLTAVSKDHPEEMRYVTTTTRRSECRDDCAITERWCGGDFDCYSESSRCPDKDSPPEVCQLEGEGKGDPSLKRAAPWDVFAGLSQDYAVAYVSAPLTDRSILAALLGAPHGLGAGYHVLTVSSVFDSKSAERATCWNVAADDSIAQINAEDGTDYMPYELERPCEDENSWTALLDSPLCDLPLAEREAVRRRYDAAQWRSRFDRGCALSLKHLKPVTDGQPIAVQLVAESGPGAVVLF